MIIGRRFRAWLRGRKVIWLLDHCEDRRTVERLFDMKGIRDPVERTRLLRRAMGNPITYHSLPLSVESEYQRELSMYCAGAWRRWR